ncbi:Aspartate/methionine/tyrosine aminotransferase [Enhydrobacter aerosaccus]|uniref:Aminotransferase n=1 Tax=Enhydrobacter aerosaccus TaxID=225324 RepID=A0A1T4K6A5_9HYPH|nr:aminotransferase [Enhydrobacter aerosaccus]SJZ37863.1 Aspartate/methionine/tyrosine aminotransferase [Enhydrobacter aerosaccus]
MRDVPATNPWLAAVEPSPIGETKRWVQGRDFPADRPLIDLSQAVPGYPPALELRQHLGTLLLDPSVHGYTPILGLPTLRDAYARHLTEFYGAPITPGEVGITSGCNQAFCLALMSIAKAGDQVILPRPHYFNHDMWIRMQGIEPVSLDFRPESGAVPHPDDAAKLIGPRTRAIVLISPNNPTGAVYPAETIHRFYELARQHGIALLLDETYKDFLPEGTRPHALFSDPGWRGTLVHLYSFSKVFALTGYRVGGVTAGAPLMAEIEKAMDCVSICPPRLGQEAALYGLHNLLPWARKNTEALKVRADLLGSGLARSNRWRLVSLGAYFAYVEHPFNGQRSTDVSKRLADEENLLTIPGDMFGAGQERFVRLAFANVPDDKIPTVLERLERFGA